MTVEFHPFNAAKLVDDYRNSNEAPAELVQSWSMSREDGLTSASFDQYVNQLEAGLANDI